MLDSVRLALRIEDRRLTLDPESANFLHGDHGPRKFVAVVYWLSLESQPVIMLAKR
jgi:hypothetical protein